MKKVLLGIVGLVLAVSVNAKEVVYQCSTVAINRIDMTKNLVEDNPGDAGINTIVVSDEMIVVKEGSLFKKDKYFPLEPDKEGITGMTQSMLLIKSSPTTFIIYLARKPFAETTDDFMVNIIGAVSLTGCREE